MDLDLCRYHFCLAFALCSSFATNCVNGVGKQSCSLFTKFMGGLGFFSIAVLGPVAEWSQNIGQRRCRADEATNLNQPKPHQTRQLLFDATFPGFVHTTPGKNGQHATAPRPLQINPARSWPAIAAVERHNHVHHCLLGQA